MKTIATILLLIWNIGMISLILLPFTKLTFIEGLTLSVIIGAFYTKYFVDNQNLQNKIFELKELIEKQSKL